MPVADAHAAEHTRCLVDARPVICLTLARLHALLCGHPHRAPGARWTRASALAIIQCSGRPRATFATSTTAARSEVSTSELINSFTRSCRATTEAVAATQGAPTASVGLWGIANGPGAPACLLTHQQTAERTSSGCLCSADWSLGDDVGKQHYRDGCAQPEGPNGEA
jgi:hypothetical protein